MSPSSPVNVRRRRRHGAQRGLGAGQNTAEVEKAWKCFLLRPSDAKTKSEQCFTVRELGGKSDKCTNSGFLAPANKMYEN